MSVSHQVFEKTSVPGELTAIGDNYMLKSHGILHLKLVSQNMFFFRVKDFNKQTDK